MGNPWGIYFGFLLNSNGTNFITTIHKLRAPGISWDRLPLNVWALYATSIIQVLATPVLAISPYYFLPWRIFWISVSLTLHSGEIQSFTSISSGLLAPCGLHYDCTWFGIISEVITTFSKKTIFGYWAIALSSLAIAFIGFLVWGHHMFTSGQSAVATTIFSFLTFLVGIPTGIKIFNWVATLYRGSISMKTPMLYVFIFIFLFSIGGFTGIMLGALSVDIHLHDTYYVVAHFHYVMMGGTLIALLAGLHYWWPKMTGKMYNEPLAKIAAGLIFIGFNVTFLPQFIMGAQGMPRRYYNYIDQFTPFHQTSTIGSYILALSFLIILYYLAL